MADLSIATAQSMIAGVPADISELREELADHHAEHPQRAMLADLALREVETGLDKLRALGHHFWLSRGDSPGTSEFPKMVYRDSPQGQLNQTVENASEEAAALAAGWRGKQSKE